MGKSDKPLSMKSCKNEEILGLALNKQTGL